jgi:tRNA/tmRNA/rRNA uracil-C5-methylase (TrmA/RlmC/RlmD family)
VIGTEFEVKVGSVAHGGHCVARYEGRVVFVRHALPGERVLVRVTEGTAGSRYLRADAIEVVAAASGRVAPPCPYAGPGKCGGCDWQHADLDTQRALKAAVLREAFRRFAGLDVDVVVEAVPGDRAGLDWRTRVKFAVTADGRVGLRQHRSHHIVPIDRCLIAHPLVHSAEVLADEWTGYDTVEVAVSVATGNRVVLPRMAGQGPRSASSAAYLTEHAAGRAYIVRADGFWQVHPGAASTLVSAVIEALGPQPGDRVLDLYSGVGLFAAALAPLVAPSGRVTAVEADGSAVACARQNLADLPTARTIRDDVDAALHRGLSGRADLVVLDPPREGAGRSVITSVARRRPRAIAYVACDPVALARDVGYAQGLGYRLTDVRAYDLFPMTQHLECVALLTRSGPGLR